MLLLCPLVGTVGVAAAKKPEAPVLSPEDVEIIWMLAEEQKAAAAFAREHFAGRDQLKRQIEQTAEDELRRAVSVSADRTEPVGCWCHPSASATTSSVHSMKSARWLPSGRA